MSERSLPDRDHVGRMDPGGARVGRTIDGGATWSADNAGPGPLGATELRQRAGHRVFVDKFDHLESIRQYGVLCGRRLRRTQGHKW